MSRRSQYRRDLGGNGRRALSTAFYRGGTAHAGDQHAAFLVRPLGLIQTEKQTASLGPLSNTVCLTASLWGPLPWI